ncbi:NTE family protein [Tenacibaculum adriaticum]|uniref:NTE family protein n=1 Tax=Tenacibaculum adriaticum TaxID=413713 RepID=A0A5S5DSV1_9FLAO|nr:patatin-like phospholipase family protein [Tenacibaculum adriaticum]TYP98971.1 NTE family protein [Tenacibaculum adriaticum]
MAQKNDKNIGIVLSGGGARAAAHIGVLQALNENNVYPSRISGTSAGALIGALYCAGYTPLEILELAKSKSFLKIFRIGFNNRGLTEMTRLKDFLNKHITNDFNELKIPLYISVTNLNLGNFEIKSSGNLIEYISATCAVPLLFRPIKIEDHLYVDGGLLNNLPVEPLINTCDKIIGVSVNSHQYKEEIKGVLQITERCLHLAVWNTIQERLKKCDIAIELDKPFNYSVFSLSKTDELFKAGYDITISKMDFILKSLN